MSYNDQDKWIKWLKQGVNQHFAARAKDKNLSLRFEAQSKPTKIDEEEATIYYFGPFFQETTGREVRINIQVRIELKLSIKRGHNIYRFDELAGWFVAAARESIHIDEFDQCLTSHRVKAIYNGQVAQPIPLEMGLIEADYTMTIES